ncbi:MAG: threonylcarbamoyl-AMP synthase [Bacteroidales bacterium]|nr:threonylcarbamoyl-AMP synthase [Bacteroidales bacterium]
MLIRLYDDNISAKQVNTIVDILNHDGIVLVPTDTLYAFVCSIHSHKAAKKLAELKGKKLEKSNFSIMCSSLSMASSYVKPISNTQFSFIKSLNTGEFTFVMQASNLTPKIFQNKKKTVGIRISQNRIITSVIEELKIPLLVTSAPHEDDDGEIVKNAELIYEKYSSIIDFAIDNGEITSEPSTVIDLTSGENYDIIRQGIGKI